jgi:hypothetical protein
MKVRALKGFISARYGDVQPDHEFECADSMAIQWVHSGMVEVVKSTYQTKVVVETPQVGDAPLVSGQAAESGSLPAAPASPKKTRKKSGKVATL